MYSYEDRIRAVKLYMKLGKRTGATIRQLGYPTKNALKSWHREFEQTKDLPAALTDAEDVGGRRYGADGLRRALGGIGIGADPDVVLAALRHDLGRFVGDAEPADDLTLLVLQRRRPGTGCASGNRDGKESRGDPRATLSGDAGDGMADFGRWC